MRGLAAGRSKKDRSARRRLDLTGAREARGARRGLAASVLRVLARRGVQVDEATRSRVVDCDDTVALEAWLDRAATATTSLDVFGR